MQCNRCGKVFDIYDEQERFGFHYTVGYGSIYDLTKIDLNLCCECFDEIYNAVKKQCVIPPQEINLEDKYFEVKTDADKE